MTPTHTARAALRTRAVFLLALFALGCFALPARASAATEIYYSVGSDTTTNYLTGSNVTVTIDGSGNATFSAAQTASSTGVGDIVTYGGSRAFITGKTSTSVWTVETATGGIPAATTSAPVASITHAFNSLRSALNAYQAGNATSTNFLNTSDLVTGNYVLNIPCYNDNGTPETTDGNMTIGGFTTGPSNYINIYTPTSTATQANASQRHTGTYDTTHGYAIQVSTNANILYITTGYVRIDGIQIHNPNGRGEITYGTNVLPVADADEYLSNSIIYGSDSPLVYDANPSTGYHFWNNVFIGMNTSGTQYAMYLSASTTNATVYNNTFYNFDYVVNIGNSPAFPAFVNNLFASTTSVFPYASAATASGSDYNSTATSSIGYGGTHTHDVLNATYSFFDAPNGNFDLNSSDTGAKDLGTSSPATDQYSPFSTDILGNARPYGSAWDIGAFEYTPTADVTPPGLSGGAPSGQIANDTTSTMLSVNTNENATCKYDTVAGTAYASMPYTFTNTGTTTSTTYVSGLQNGHIYNYYVRCEDTSNNVNTSDYTISFEVNQGTNGTVYANSCSVSDTNAAMAYVNDGDTLSIPAGTCGGYSSSSGLAISKAITVMGAGEGQTILQISSTTPGTYFSGAIMPIYAAATVENMTIETDTSSTANSGTAFTVSGGVNGFRITNVQYIGRTTHITGYFVGVSTGAYGLIDHNDVTGGAGNNELILVYGPTDSWQQPESMGESDAVYIENNTIGGTGYVTDCNANSRCVVRDNTITGPIKIDGHGKASNTPARGVRQYEAYDNAWTDTSDLAWTAIEMRGGTGIIFGNTSSQTAGANAAWFYLTDYAYTAAWPNFSSTYQCLNNYPVDDQIGVGEDPKAAASEPYYLWNNSLGGQWWPLDWKAVPATTTSGCSQSFVMSDVIKPNRDFYISSTSVAFDGTANGTSAGVGSGLYANMPSTCTTGVAYWATDKGGNWDASNGTSEDGALYKCTATNTWTLSYTPYAYPDYLTAASTTGVDQVDIGGGARFFGTGTFYALSTSTMSGTYATLAATTTPIAASTATSSADYWLDVSISKWLTSGTYEKTWTETSTTLGATTTHHMVGDLAANAPYSFTIDGSPAISNISSAQCSSGTCTSDSSGKIYFDYTGGYTTHTFDLVQSGSGTVYAPTVTTSAASSITTASATANGDVTSTGGANATVRGFTYGTTASYGATTTESGSFAAGTFTGSISSLVCGTTYHVRAYATNSTGTGYGSDQTFTTTACPTSPTVTTQAVSSIGSTVATGNGTITSTGGENATAEGVALGLTTTYSDYISSSGSFGTGSFTASLSGLSCSTTYHVAAFATNPIGTSYGSDETFTTSACAAPTVANGSVTSIGRTTATISGSISDTGGHDATDSGFAVGTASDLSNAATTTLGAETGNASFSSNQTGLSCGTTYYFRAYAVNTIGTGLGSIGSFTTSACQAAVVTAPVVVSGGGGGGSSAYTAPLYAPGVVAPSNTNSTDMAAPIPFRSLLTVPSVGAFTTTVSAGAHAAEVKSLQRVLNSLGFIVAETGAGSPGNETETFGPATKRAVEAFQSYYGIATAGSLGYGVVGPMTRAKLNELENAYGGSASMASTSTSPSTSSSSQSASASASAPATMPSAASPVASGYAYGSTGANVRVIQIFLNSHGFAVAASGAGSPGHESAYYGAGTRKAVEAFQLYYKIAEPGDPGFGMVGPMTAAKMNAI